MSINDEDEKSAGMDKSDKGYSAREFRTFLQNNDPDSCWGGLKRVVLPSGHNVWLCTACFLNVVNSNDTKKEMQMVEERPNQHVVVSTSLDANLDAVRKELGK